MHADLETVLTEALRRAGHTVSQRVVLEGVTGSIYAQDLHVTQPSEVMVWIHHPGPADEDVVGRVYDALRDVGLDRAFLISPEGFTPEAEAPEPVTLWDVRDLARILDRPLPWRIDPAAVEPAEAPIQRAFDPTPRSRARADVTDAFHEALDSAENLISVADGILDMGPVTDPDKQTALEGFSRMLESLDDEKDDDVEEPIEPPDLPALPELPDVEATSDDDEDPEVTVDPDPPDGFFARAIGEVDDHEPTPPPDRPGDEGSVAVPVIDDARATNLVTGMVHGPMETRLEHVAHYLYRYSMKMQDETNGHREHGQMWVHTETLEVEPVPDDVAFEEGDIGHAAQREDKARERVRETILEEHVRRTKIIKDDENVTLVEERDVRPDPKTLEVELEGVVGKPFWRIAGQNGEVLVDAIVGEIAQENLASDGDDDVMMV